MNHKGREGHKGFIFFPDRVSDQEKNPARTGKVFTESPGRSMFLCVPPVSARDLRAEEQKIRRSEEQMIPVNGYTRCFQLYPLLGVWSVGIVGIVGIIESDVRHFYAVR